MKLKEKIKKLNASSIFIIITILTLSSFVITYVVIYHQLQNDIKLISKAYIENQKALMKHQVENVISAIENIRKSKTEETKERLKLKSHIISSVLNEVEKHKYKEIAKIFDVNDLLIKVTLSDLNANLIYTHLKDYNKTKRLNLIRKMLKNHLNDIYFEHQTPLGKKITFQHIFKNYLLSTCVYQKEIDKLVQKQIINMIYTIRFGAKNNGYISIAKILNYKGGKKFAQVLVLPVNPKMEGKFLDEDKTDIKGKPYRKEYLKIINTTKEGFVTYYFYKYSTNVMRPKISYVKLYKPYNWAIFASIFVDDIQSLLDKKKEAFNKEVKKLIIFYLILFIIMVLIGINITKYENEMLDKIIEEYEKEIQKHEKELKELNENLQQEVEHKTQELIKTMFTDTKTNLPNREQLLNNLEDNYVAIINIDDFKEINDFYGIEEGDKLLKEFGKFLNSIYPTYKLAADEYAILAKNQPTLRKIASNIINRLKNHKFKVKDEEIKLRISVGIGKNLQEADTALKYSKKRKKPIIVFNKNLPILKEYEKNLKWKKILDEVIEKKEVVPFVQAIVDNETKEPKKYECLMRIRHNGEIYTPYHFLEISKKTHQYETLQRIMIDKCFEKFQKLDYEFSINVSISDLKSSNFRTFLKSHIKKYNIAHKLTIEILEDEELVKDKILNRTLFTLNDMGVKIAIDDFGSGYSNFIYLIKDIPLDLLKIDGSLVKDILKDEKLLKLLEKIVEIAQSFNLKTVAEFVENEEIYQTVKSINVDCSQGYYFSQPFKLEDLK